VSRSRQCIGVVMGLFIGLGLGVVMETKAAPRQATKEAPEVLQARQFQVVDRDGTVRMQLGLEADGASRLTMLGPNNKKALVAQVNDRGEASFSLRDHNEQERASISVSEEKGTVVALTGSANGDAQPIAALAVLPDNSEALSMVHIRPGADGKPVRTGTAITASADGKTEMRYYGKNGKVRVVTP
jgi:hypothetical protein